MTYVCSWGRVYSGRGNCHLMVLWFHGCLFPAFPYYPIWDAEYKSAPANTDLKSSNKDHNIRSTSSVSQPTARRSGLGKTAFVRQCAVGAWWTASRVDAVRLPVLKGKQKQMEMGKQVIWNQDHKGQSATDTTFPFVLALTLGTSGKPIKLRCNSEWTWRT